MKRRWIAIILLLIIITGAFFLIYSRINQVRIYNLEKDYGISGKVIESGVYEDFDDIMNRLNEEYSKNKDKGEIYFVVGNKEGVRLVRYADFVTGKIVYLTPNSQEKMEITRKEFVSKTLIPENDRVEIDINGKVYSFNLKSGQGLYMIVAKEGVVNEIEA